MKYRNPLIVLGTALLFTLSTPLTAATDSEEAVQAAEAEKQSQLEADYQKALAEVEKERHKAEASMEKTRKQLQLISEQRAKSTEENSKARAAQAAEMAEMHEELSRVRKSLRETSREIARVDREVARARANDRSYNFVYRTSARPVIGLVLGEADDAGIKTLGVSPDGPAERAGIQQGDVIIALGGRVLSAVDESGDVRSGLNIALKDIKADEPVIISVRRDDKTIDLTVVPEIREPLGWHTVMRFPSAPVAPASPGDVITIERIVVPEIDTEKLAERIEEIRVKIDARLPLITAGNVSAFDGYEFDLDEYEFEFHDMSELGDLALYEANMWFGLPMTQGLKLAGIDPGLGEYFKTDRGVLVLKARAENDLQLESGDVILQVGDTEVNSPAEFMRALREIEPGEELIIDIKRNRKDQTLKTMMPERRISLFAPEIGTTHSIRISH